VEPRRENGPGTAKASGGARLPADGSALFAKLGHPAVLKSAVVLSTAAVLSMMLQFGMSTAVL